jgi:hypothetical protein
VLSSGSPVAFPSTFVGSFILALLVWKFVQTKQTKSNSNHLPQQV